jgi:hypothetical protein
LQAGGGDPASFCAPGDQVTPGKSKKEKLEIIFVDLALASKKTYLKT